MDLRVARCGWCKMSDRLGLEETLFHHPTSHHAGNGRDDPYEFWVTCSCGEFDWDWQQYYNEHDDLDECWEEHIHE